ncbi:MmcQ/YjbR family DNA-binding protein [Stappia sp. ES.058]|uniref:MmcQ/YjbR family DNA-binding protein n=1 Tax=Stappia sp. ES.058 TaxID=1881061 RepID=UPI000B89FE1D|nr:MmcQ/YjbR family DNA-binding protein [Stappia sp. ES.058]
MTRAQFNAYCRALPGATSVVQWGGASVWKVGGKIFALCSTWGPVSEEAIAFKCSDLASQMLCERDGVVPAPYLARAKWVQVRTNDALSDDDIRAYLSEAHRLIAAKLTRKQRADLGLCDPTAIPEAPGCA